MKLNLFHLLGVLGFAAGCGSGGGQQAECTPGDSCGNGQYCESYVDSGDAMHSACFAPTLLKGKITDASSGAAVVDARVVAVDGDSHAAVGPVSITDATGNYSVRVTAPRMSGAEKEFTLRVSAARYEEFPSGIRIALPIRVAFTDPKAAAGIDGPQDVELTALSQPPAGSIAGRVSGARSAGILVVASDGTHAYSTVSDAAGEYVLFNVNDGTFSVRGYFIGMNYTPAENVAVAGARRDGVDLVASGEATAGLTGTLTYVAGADTSITTAVVLRLQSTREVPPGLQAPAMNGVSYRLDKIPDGTYEVVAGFPTDQLVKDPDPGQAGTTTPVVIFTGNTVDVGSFKITNPVNMVGPDASAKVSGTPTFSWAAYPQTDHYKVEVFGAQGNLIWSTDSVPRSTSLSYGGPPLQVGGYYQWRITSFAQVANAASRPISQSEDLRGVWQQM